MAPEAGAAKSTVTPLRRLPPASFTVTWRAVAKASPRQVRAPVPTYRGRAAGGTKTANATRKGVARKREKPLAADGHRYARI